jgi:hypothetical protein
MAVQTPGLFPYSEWAARTENGKLSTLVNLMSQYNAVMEDSLAAECTNGNAFQFTQVVGLPTPSRRSYNSGVQRTTAQATKQVVTCSEYADWSVIDNSLVELGGNRNELRAQELALHMEGMSQKIASDLFYGNKSTDPTAFNGFANIYNTVNPANSAIASNVIDGGGTGSTNSSIWLVGWGPKQIHTIFPQGMVAGMQHKDLGLLPCSDSNGLEFMGWRDWLQFNIGLAIHDWRYCVRAANLDVSLFGTTNAANLINILQTMTMKPPVMPAGVAPVQSSDDKTGSVTMARSAFYMNRTVYAALDKQAQNKTNVLLKMEEWDGHPILTYRGIPIRVVDALLTTESRVV